MSEAEQALREAEQLIADTRVEQTGGRSQATQGEFYLRRGAPKLAIAAFRRQAELCRRAGDVHWEHIALGNLGCAQLDAGELDAAIESLRRSVDGLRSIHAPYGLEFRLGTLAVALAWRGDDVDILPLAREAFDDLRVARCDVRPTDRGRPAALPTRRSAARRPAHRVRVQQAAAAEAHTPDRAAHAATGARPRRSRASCGNRRVLATRGRAPDRRAGSGDRVRRGPLAGLP